MDNDFPTSSSEIRAYVKGLKGYGIQHGFIALLCLGAYFLLIYSAAIRKFINNCFKCSFNKPYGNFILLSIIVLVIWSVDSLFIFKYKKDFIPKTYCKHNKKDIKDYKTYEKYSAFSKQWLNILTIVSLLLDIITIDGIGKIGYIIVCIIMFATFNIYLRRSEINLYTLKIKCESVKRTH